MVPLCFEDEPVGKWQYASKLQANMFLKELILVKVQKQYFLTRDASQQIFCSY